MSRRELQIKCSTALRCYVELVQEGCDLLGSVKDTPMSEYERKKIFAHRRQELHAHGQYTKARQALWDFLVDSKPRDRHNVRPSLERSSKSRSKRESVSRADIRRSYKKQR
jgi:hypothetical protein